jgi:hypothetical protein
MKTEQHDETYDLTSFKANQASGGNSLFPMGGGGAKPPKFPTKPSNFRQTPPPICIREGCF